MECRYAFILTAKQDENPNNVDMGIIPLILMLSLDTIWGRNLQLWLIWVLWFGDSHIALDFHRVSKLDFSIHLVFYFENFMLKFIINYLKSQPPSSVTLMIIPVPINIWLKYVKSHYYHFFKDIFLFCFNESIIFLFCLVF